MLIWIRLRVKLAFPSVVTNCKIKSMSIYGSKMSLVFGKSECFITIHSLRSKLTKQYHESNMSDGRCIFLLPELPMPPSTYWSRMWSPLRRDHLQFSASICRAEFPLYSESHCLWGFPEFIWGKSGGSLSFSISFLFPETQWEPLGIHRIRHVYFNPPCVSIVSPDADIIFLTPGLVVYSFINSHMTLLVPILRKAQNSRSVQTGTPGSGRSLIPDDSVLAEIRTALSRWRDHWEALHSQVSEDQWASMGFYKNGYNFWLVSQLLITKKASVDVVMQMEVKCEDKLEKLNVLLMDE